MNTPEFDHKIAVNEYGFYCVPDEYLKREVPKLLMQGKVYEPDTINLIKRLAGKGDVIAGGAFVGDFFPAISQALDNKAQLHSFEPHPTSFEAASYTVQLNGLKNVKLHPLAIGSEEGNLPLLVANAKGQSMSAQTKIVLDDHAGTKVNVDVKTLDQIVPKSRKISVLQLDIEGHEVPAILGAKRILNDHAPVVILEGPRPWKQQTFQDALDEACGAGTYRLTGVMERNAVYLRVS